MQPDFPDPGIRRDDDDRKHQGFRQLIMINPDTLPAATTSRTCCRATWRSAPPSCN